MGILHGAEMQTQPKRRSEVKIKVRDKNYIQLDLVGLIWEG